MSNIIKEKKKLLEKRIKALPSRSRENILKQLENAKNLNDLMLIEKTLNLTDKISLATKHHKKESKDNKAKEKTGNNQANKTKKEEKKVESFDEEGASNLQIRFAIKKDDYIWKIKTSDLPREQKEDLIKVIEDLDKDNALDLLKKWEMLNEMKKYIPR